VVNNLYPRWLESQIFWENHWSCERETVRWVLLAKIAWFSPSSRFIGIPTSLNVFCRYCHLDHWSYFVNSWAYHEAFDTQIHHFLLFLLVLCSCRVYTSEQGRFETTNEHLIYCWFATMFTPLFFSPNFPCLSIWWTMACDCCDWPFNFCWVNLILLRFDTVVGFESCYRSNIDCYCYYWLACIFH
jgi:hypothetical protein